MTPSTRPTCLFVDDERFPPDNPSVHYVTVRTVPEAQEWIQAHGLPERLSLDHDLGEHAPGGDAIHLANWLVERHLDGHFDLRKCTIDVHSQNPCGAANLRGKFNRLPEPGISPRRSAFFNLPQPEDLRQDPVNTHCGGNHATE